MDGIGSVSTLASAATQPFVMSQVASADTASVDESAGASDTASGASSSGEFSSDYAMSLLAKITHASADQALALIQAMQTPVSPLR